MTLVLEDYITEIKAPTVYSAYITIREHFSQPDAQLGKYNGECYYRHPEDNRPCAIGVLLPDHIASTADNMLYMFGLPNTLDIILKHFPELNSWNERRLLRFLLAAQNAHDEVEDAPAFVRALDTIYSTMREMR